MPEVFEVRQKWEGYVLELGEETFYARLICIEGEGPDLEAEIELEAVNPTDRDLVQRGAYFYWSIGYLKRSSGTIRHSLIRFRRLPPMTDADWAQAEAKADALMALFEEPAYA